MEKIVHISHYLLIVSLCGLCLNSADVCFKATTSCTKECGLSINSSNLNPESGEDITLTCVSNLPDEILTFNWKKDGQVINENSSMLLLLNVLSTSAGFYNCSVNSICGNYSAQYYVSVSDNNVLLLVVCGVSALALVLIMGLVMKFKLKRDNAKHRERRKQREQVGQSGGPAPFTPRQ